MKFKGFTLAEVMIVLTVIGILAGILIPVANNSRPDENVMKFKKAHATLANVIHELVTSDKYFCNGYLAYKADCTTGLTNDDEHRTYFCSSIADLLSVKKVNCLNKSVGVSAYLLSDEFISNIATGSKMTRTVTEATIKSTKQKFDTFCKTYAKTIGQEIITTDNIVYYQAGAAQFASRLVPPNEQNGLSSVICLPYFSPPDQFPANYADQNGFDIAYKTYCIDIDGFDEAKGSENCDDIKDICPFGYGIRGDGKIMPGARADEWLEKGFQKGKKDN